MTGLMIDFIPGFFSCIYIMYIWYKQFICKNEDHPLFVLVREGVDGIDIVCFNEQLIICWIGE